MPAGTITRPTSDEHPAFFATYIDKVPDGDVLERLAAQPGERGALWDLDEARAMHRYEPGKWSLKKVLGHITDTERVLAYRLLRFARGDATPLPGFDQDILVAGAGSDAVPLPQLLKEFEAVRAATLALLSSLPPEAAARSGEAEGRAITAGALAWTIAGHEIHHQGVIRERYL